MGEGFTLLFTTNYCAVLFTQQQLLILYQSCLHQSILSILMSGFLASLAWKNLLKLWTQKISLMTKLWVRMVTAGVSQETAWSFLFTRYIILYLTSPLWKALMEDLSMRCGVDQVLSPSTIARKMKLKFTKAWISFLRLPLPIDIYKEVLATLHQVVIPHLSNPIILCDFLTRSYDIGGVVSVMALSSLFILMTQHGLEYPNFYEKLYALLAPSIFMAKHRAKFFQLLDSCLKSPLLPAYLAAAFAKKLSRLAISVPPSGALVIIALIHNLLRRHPSINCLVHQEDGFETQEDIVNKAEDSGLGTDISRNRPGIDHFNNEESNPIKSNAMRSSLWEIDSLRHHYCPPVSRFVLSLENDLTVRSKTTEMDIKDFSSGSYATIFGDEIRRRVKQVPLEFYKATPTSLFSESEFSGWTFKYEDGKENDTGREEQSMENSSKENDVATKRQRIECS
ncbi:Nucleolar complex protein 4, putative isoform 2 [Theobroma cacao]|uniref:Nucleolar complex protein 4, putative isoform 2 n=1 Tax=Theobroma cacao TaxID=3641 RepID=A0A061E1H9_THECC|nr:Nucleolar complex protein 4, putative isoform 2 [Theobroma cacao]